MPDTNISGSNQKQQVKSNGGSNQSSDNIEEAIRRLKIQDNHDQNGGGGDVTEPGSYPDRPGEPDCIYYLRNGVCGYASNCRYNHPNQHAPPLAKGSKGGDQELPERAGEPDCGYYLKTGTCKYGTTCRYHHPKDRNGAGPVSYNLLGLPMRQDEKPCSFYMRTGSCKFGGACKFHHPQPPPAAAPLEPGGIPLSGLSTYGTSTGSPMIPRLPYMSAPPRFDSTPAFAPVYISPPSQGGWNNYGNLSPMASPPSILGSNLVFNMARNQGGSGMYMPSYSLLPQRVDQPECRHFMNTGTCRYGSDCKYHHPKERRTPPPLAINAAPGLPSRPGQALCPNYITYGICKFGTSCRFDHPFTGYPYNYSFAIPPPLPMLDSSMVTSYPRMVTSSPSYNVYNGSARNINQQHQTNNAGTNNKKTTAPTPTPTTPPDETTTNAAPPR